MKYGIRATHTDGTVTYCASTKQPWFSEDIDKMATFVQEKSAIKALKSLRADWYDRLTKVDLDVVTVSLSVKDVMSVPVPHPPKSGYVVIQDHGDKFSYLRSSSSWCCWHELIVHATVYGSTDEAQAAAEMAQGETDARLQEMIALRYQLEQRIPFDLPQHEADLIHINNRINEKRQEKIRLERLTIQSV